MIKNLHNTKMSTSTKILILYTKAGGGHESAARTLEQEFSKQGFEVEIFDPLAENSVARYIPKIYSYLVECLPWLWFILIYLWRQKLFMHLNYIMLSTLVGDSLNKKLSSLLENQGANQETKLLVISTYFFLEKLTKDLLLSSRNKAKKQAKFQLRPYKFVCKTCTLVTEQFTPPKIWFFDSQGNYLVFSTQAKKIAIQAGVRIENIHQFGFFFNPKFNLRPNEIQIKSLQKQLGLEVQATILLLGGGDGLPKAEKIFKELLSLKVKCWQEYTLSLGLIAVCGRNNRLYQTLQKQKKDFLETFDQAIAKKLAQNIQILAFTNQVWELINLADVVISKAGAASVMEISSQNKPLILSHYIWEQELGNKDFILEKKLGVYEPNPLKIARLLHDLLFESYQAKQTLEKIFWRYLGAKNTDTLVRSDVQTVLEFLVDYLNR